MTQDLEQNIEIQVTDEAPKMRSAAFYKLLSPAKQQAMLKEAKGGTWYDGWKPYCMTCSTMSRMESKDYGFRCSSCGNQIGFDCYSLLESPLNHKQK